MDKKYKVKKKRVAVVVARFQLHELHAAHKALLNKILEDFDELIIVLGIPPLQQTSKNPLNLEMRKQMLKEEFSNYMHRVRIAYIHNNKDDAAWSANLDKLISKLTKSNNRVILCGGRDSFIPYYKTNKYEVKEYPEFYKEEYLSATSTRKEIANSTEFNKDFRAGVVHSACNVYPACVPSVDLVILNDQKTHVLLGLHIDETKYKFLGSWVRAGETYEYACYRTAKTKANVIVENFMPLHSFTGFDWRFIGEDSDLTTMLYECTILNNGESVLRAMGNFKRLKWVPLNKVVDNIINEHIKLAQYVEQKYTI